MDKQYHFLKKPYLPPRLTAVSFKVEDAFVSSPVTLSLPLFGGGDGSGMSPYGSTANSGSFWDSDLNASGQTNSYGNYDNEGRGFWN